MHKVFHFQSVALVVMCAVVHSGTAEATSLTIDENVSVTSVVSDLTGFQTTGEHMGGQMQVTAFFEGGASDTVPWLATGSGVGMATGTGALWSLRESGDTFDTFGASGRWSLEAKTENIRIDRLLLTGVGTSFAVGGTVFDRTFADNSGTPGSYRGSDFQIETARGPWDLRVTYTDLVDSAADGVGPLKDIFGKLQIDFVGSPTARGYFTFGDDLFFRQDTDTVGPRMPCLPGQVMTAEGACVPEPSAFVQGLIVLGLSLPTLLRHHKR